MLTPGNRRRLRQLFDAALNLGMSKAIAQYYAMDALKREIENGSYSVAPRSAEAIIGDQP